MPSYSWSVTQPPLPSPVPEATRFSPLVPASDGADFGDDVSTFTPGLDPTFTLISGSQVLRENLARRLQTPRGSIPFAEDYGTDVNLWLSEGMLEDDLDELKMAVEQECLKDERVLDAKAAIEFNAQTQELRLDVAVDTEQGPFRLVVSVDKLNMRLLNPEEI